jgi:hypothetical protein
MRQHTFQELSFFEAASQAMNCTICGAWRTYSFSEFFEYRHYCYYYRVDSTGEWLDGISEDCDRAKEQIRVAEATSAWMLQC